MMLSEEDDSESEISEIYVFDEANDMEEGYRSMHDDDSGDDNVQSGGSEDTDDSNEQGTDYSMTVNAMQTRLILLYIESGPSGSRAGVARGRSRGFRRGMQLGWFEKIARFFEVDTRLSSPSSSPSQSRSPAISLTPVQEPI